VGPLGKIGALAGHRPIELRDPSCVVDGAVDLGGVVVVSVPERRENVGEQRRARGVVGEVEAVEQVRPVAAPSCDRVGPSEVVEVGRDPLCEVERRAQFVVPRRDPRLAAGVHVDKKKAARDDVVIAYRVALFGLDDPVVRSKKKVAVNRVEREERPGPFGALRRVDALKAVADKLPTESHILPFETTDFDALEDIVEQAWAWTGRVDVLVNNAGVSQRSLAIHTKPQVYTDLINIDLIAPIWLTQLQLPKMADAGGAHIIAISSVAGRIGAPLRTAYSAAKHGLIGYMDALRTEVQGRHNINVTNVLPGSVATNVSRNAFTADGTTRGKSDDAIEGGDDPMDCANAILDAVRNNVPELLFASGMELDIAKLRHSDSDKLFQLTGQLGAQIAEQYESGDDS